MDTYLIAAIGNPGKTYASHRHNVGFLVADALAARQGWSFNQKKYQSVYADGVIAGQRVVLAKPQTYVNLSGESVGPLAGYYKVPPARVMAVCDDLDLPLATLRLREKGGSGGHNGLKSLAYHLRTQEFPRLRIGIGRPPLEATLGRRDDLVTAHVLGSFTADERGRIIETIARALAAIDRWIADGIQAAMNEVNQNGSPV